MLARMWVMNANIESLRFCCDRPQRASPGLRVLYPVEAKAMPTGVDPLLDSAHCEHRAPDGERAS
jgi:hypothetical protein